MEVVLSAKNTWCTTGSRSGVRYVGMRWMPDVAEPTILRGFPHE
jgi:hypothetical protein